MDVTSSVISLFGTAIQFFDFVQIARGFPEDFEIYQLKLDVAQLRLSRWGKAAGIGEDASGSLNLPEDLQEEVENFLFKINAVFKRAQDDADSMQPRAPASPQVFDPAQDLSPRVKRLRLKLKTVVKARCEQVADTVSNTLNQAKWAFYKKDRFDTFIEGLLGLIEQLEELFPAEPQEKLQELGREEMKVIDKNDLKVLGNVADCDPLLEELVAEAIQAQGGGKTMNISASMRDNYGLQVGYNKGKIQGNAFGSGNTLTHHWGNS